MEEPFSKARVGWSEHSELQHLCQGVLDFATLSPTYAG